MGQTYLPVAQEIEMDAINFDDVTSMDDTSIQEYVDSRGFNILMLAAEAGHAVAVQNIIDRDEEVNNEVDGETAASLAFTNGHYDIVLRFLKVNSRMPYNYDHSAASDDLKAFVELSVDLHERVKSGNEENLEDFKEKLRENVEKNPNMRHFYDLDNNSLLKTAILSKMFVVYEILLTFYIFLGPHESMNDILKNLTKKVRKKIRDINFRISPDVLTEEMMILMRNCKLGPDTPEDMHSECMKLIREGFDFLFKIPLIAIVLRIIAAYRNFKIVFDFKRDSVTFLDPSAEPYTNGLFYTNGKIYIAARDMLDKNTACETYAVMAHEFCHYAMCLAFGNNGKPYDGEDEKLGVILNKICEDCERHKVEEPYVESVYDDYPKEYHHTEIIVRAPHMLALYFNDKNVLQEKIESYRSLFDFYKKICVPKLEKELPKIEEKFNPFKKAERKHRKRIIALTVVIAIAVAFGVWQSLSLFSANVLLTNSTILLNSTRESLINASIALTNSTILLKNSTISLSNARKSLANATVDWSSLSDEQKYSVKNSFVDFHGAQVRLGDIFAPDSCVYANLSSKHINDAIRNETYDLSQTIMSYYNHHVYLTWSNMTEVLKKNFLISKVNFQGENVELEKIVSDTSTLSLLDAHQVRGLFNKHSFNVSTKFQKKTVSGFVVERVFINEDYYLAGVHNRNGRINRAHVDIKNFDNVFTEVEEKKIFILSSAAGEGKTTCFQSIVEKIKKIYPTKWVQYVDLKKYIDLYKVGDKMIRNCDPVKLDDEVNVEIARKTIGKLKNVESFEFDMKGVLKNSNISINVAGKVKGDDLVRFLKENKPVLKSIEFPTMRNYNETGKDEDINELLGRLQKIYESITFYCTIESGNATVELEGKIPGSDVKIFLKENQTILDSLQINFFKKLNKKCNFDKFLGEKLLKLEGFELKVFSDLYTLGNVTFLFDGADEIFPKYENFLFDVTKSILEETENWQLISTRPQYSKKFQAIFDTNAYKLVPLQKYERFEILVNFLAPNITRIEDDKLFLLFNLLNRRRWTNERLAERFSQELNIDLHFSGVVIEKIRKSHDIFDTIEGESDQVSSPLLIRMVGEVIEDDEFEVGDFNINLFAIYEAFVGKKLELVHGKGKVVTKDYDKFSRSFSFTVSHVHLAYAIKLLIGNSYFDYLSNQDENITNLLLMESINQFTAQEISRFGILEVYSHEEFAFNHRTFAEFFLASFVINSMVDKVNTKTDDGKALVSIFIKALLKENFPIIKSFLSDQASTRATKFLKHWDTRTKKLQNLKKLTRQKGILEMMEYSLDIFFIFTNYDVNLVNSLSFELVLDKPALTDFIEKLDNFENIVGTEIIRQCFCIRTKNDKTLLNLVLTHSVSELLFNKFLTSMENKLKNEQIEPLLINKSNLNAALVNKNEVELENFWNFTAKVLNTKDKMKSYLEEKDENSVTALQVSMSNLSSFNFIKEKYCKLFTNEEIEMILRSKPEEILQRVSTSTDLEAKKEVIKFLSDISGNDTNKFFSFLSKRLWDSGYLTSEEKQNLNLVKTLLEDTIEQYELRVKLIKIIDDEISKWTRKITSGGGRTKILCRKRRSKIPYSNCRSGVLRAATINNLFGYH